MIKHPSIYTQPEYDMSFRTLMVVVAITLAGCGGGGSDVEVDTKSSDRSGYVTFGMSSAEVIESDLADNDPTNDSLALVMREAGGIGPYVDLPDEERQRLHTKYATSPESRSQPLAGLARDLTACVPYLAPTYRSGEFRLSGQPHNYRVDLLGRPEWALAYFREGRVTTALRDGCTTTVGSWGIAPLPPALQSRSAVTSAAT
jgi:hypothetical protein